MAKRIAVFLFSCLFLLPAGVAAAGPGTIASQGDWRQYRGGADHRGVNRYEDTIGVANVASLEMKWMANQGFNSSPAVANGVVYLADIGVFNGRLAAFRADCANDGSTCIPLWYANAGYADWSSPAVAGGYVYLQTVEGFFAYKVGCRKDGGECQPVWTGTAADAAYTSVSVAGGFAYVATAGGYLQAYDTAACAAVGGQCAPEWVAPMGGETHSSPAVADGVVYIAGADGFLNAFKARCATGGATCSPIWRGAIKSFAFSSPAVSGSAVYLATSAGRLFVFPTSCRFGDGTCQPLWRAKLPAEVHSSPAVTDTTVYLPSGRRLWAFPVGCATDGRLCSPLWHSTRTGPGGGFASSPAVANGLVFVGSQDNYQSNGRLLAFRAECGRGNATCRPSWESPMLGGMVNSSPTVSHGQVYVSSNSNVTYAFGLPEAP